MFLRAKKGRGERVQRVCKWNLYIVEIEGERVNFVACPTTGGGPFSLSWSNYKIVP